MPMSHDVNLPIGYTPVFPSRCVVCDADDPDSALAARAVDILPLSWAHPGRKRTVATPPACRRCRGRYSRQRWLRRLTTLVIVIALVELTMWLVPRGTPMRGLITLGAAVAGLIPMWWWELTHPLPFDMTQMARTVDYEFANAEYAREFAYINEDASRAR